MSLLFFNVDQLHVLNGAAQEFSTQPLELFHGIGGVTA
jgi:hypothetical protein